MQALEIQPIVEEPLKVEMEVDHGQSSLLAIKQERIAPEAPMIARDPPKDTIQKELKGVSSPTSNISKDQSGNSSSAVNLDDAVPVSSITPAPDTIVLSDPTIDALFDMPEDSSNNSPSNNNIADTDLNFDMDFLDSTNTHNSSEIQNNDFDLSTFGNAQGFSMDDLQLSNISNEPANARNTLDDELFGLAGDTGGDDMDLNASMRNGEENSFADMYYTGDDDGTAELDDFFK